MQLTREDVQLKKLERTHPDQKLKRDYQIAKEFKEWEPVVDIAEKHNISRQRVYQILHKFVQD